LNLNCFYWFIIAIVCFYCCQSYRLILVKAYVFSESQVQTTITINYTANNFFKKMKTSIYQSAHLI